MALSWSHRAGGVCLLGLAGSESAAQTYTIHDLGTLGWTNSTTLAINASGAVVGASETLDGSIRAFLWDNGVMTSLDALGDFGFAGGISDHRVIVGATGAGRRVLLRRGALIDLGSIGGDFALAIAISESGRIVGAAAFESFQHPRDPTADV